ncbi:hypothetical protein RUND412_000027 [Rhizina undulata]
MCDEFQTIFDARAALEYPVSKPHSVAMSCPENPPADIEIRNLNDLIRGGKLIIGGNAITVELFEIREVRKRWREWVDNQGAIRALTVRGFAATVEEFDCFKIRFERILESSEVSDLDVESIRIMQFEDKEYFNAIFKFYTVSAAKTVKDAIRALGYDPFYDKDPCEWSVDELSVSFALVELEEFADSKHDDCSQRKCEVRVTPWRFAFSFSFLSARVPSSRQIIG